MLTLPVDSAGHAHGVGDDYRAAAERVDAMLARTLGGVDLARDTIIVTADHGHVAGGGHGGVEPEVVAVPLVLAGAGIAPGAQIVDARLVDLAPTLAALLGVPAPGHALGRVLGEALAIDPVARETLATRDADRQARLQPAIAAADDPGTARAWLAAGGVLVGWIAIAKLVPRRRATASAVLPMLAVIGLAIAIALRGTLSPSAIPDRDELVLGGLVAAPFVIALQLVVTLRVARTPGEANALAACVLTAVLGVPIAGALALAVEHVRVPMPATLALAQIGAGACAVGAGCVAIAHAIVSLVLRRRTRRASRDP